MGLTIDKRIRKCAKVFKPGEPITDIIPSSICMCCACVCVCVFGYMHVCMHVPPSWPGVITGKGWKKN